MIRVKIEEPSSESETELTEHLPDEGRVVQTQKTRTPWEVRVKIEPLDPSAKVHVKREPEEWRKRGSKGRAYVKREPDSTPDTAEKIRVKLEEGGYEDVEENNDVVEVIDLVRDPDQPPWSVKIEAPPTQKEGIGKKKPTTVTAQAEEAVRKTVVAVQRARRVDAERKSTALARVAGGLADERPRPAWEEERDEAAIPPLATWENDREGRKERLDTPREDRLVCLKNYAAVGVEYDDPSDLQPDLSTKTNSSGWIGSCYGLIDRGTKDGGIRTLLMHSKEHGTPHPRFGRPLLDRVQVGMSLHVHSTVAGGGSGKVRVRFTTPARYYSPGERVTTLTVGVDAADWQSLTPKRRRI